MLADVCIGSISGYIWITGAYSTRIIILLYNFCQQNLLDITCPSCLFKAIMNEIYACTD